MEDELLLAIKVLEQHNYKTLEPLQDTTSYGQPGDDEAKIRKAIFVDVETTGLDPKKDVVIEIAMVPFKYDFRTGEIYDVGQALNQLQDPGYPIPAEITRITGITDETVAGQSIDQQQVSDMLAGADLVIAHSAEFDRKFLEKMNDEFEKKAFACSINDIDWDGYASRALNYLAYRHGFWFDAHRAQTDCRAGIHLLTKTLDSCGILAMQCLLTRSRQQHVRIYAIGTHYDKKDVLSDNDFTWSDGKKGQPKCWWIDARAQDVAGMMGWLRSIYDSDNKFNEIIKVVINAENRYSDRFYP